MWRNRKGTVVKEKSEAKDVFDGVMLGGLSTMNTVWEMIGVKEGTQKIFLDMGWEPFAVISQPYRADNIMEQCYATIVYLRRQVRKD
jgi:hypothetical protein